MSSLIELVNLVTCGRSNSTERSLNRRSVSLVWSQIPPYSLHILLISNLCNKGLPSRGASSPVSLGNIHTTNCIKSVIKCIGHYHVPGTVSGMLWEFEPQTIPGLMKLTVHQGKISTNQINTQTNIKLQLWLVLPRRGTWCHGA